MTWRQFSRICLNEYLNSVSVGLGCRSMDQRTLTEKRDEQMWLQPWNAPASSLISKKRFWYSKPGVTQMVKPNKSLQFDLGVPSQKTSYLQLWSPKTFMFLGHPTKHMEPTFTYIFTVKKWSREKGHKGNLWIFPSPIWLLLTSPQFVSEDCPLQTARHGRHRDPSCYSPGVSAGDVLKNYWGHLEGWGIWRNGPFLWVVCF